MQLFSLAVRGVFCFGLFRMLYGATLSTVYVYIYIHTHMHTNHLIAF